MRLVSMLPCHQHPVTFTSCLLVPDCMFVQYTEVTARIEP